MRYLQPPEDKKFWKAATALKNPVPDALFETISHFFELERMRISPLLKGDELLYKYIIENKNVQEVFPINNLIQEYEKEWFTPDDNDFYNRVIYEKENRKLREENDQLKIDLEEAKKAEKNLINNDYQRIRQLGIGGYGRVYLVRHRISSAYLAIKQLIVKDSTRQEDILREIQALAPLNHQNVINYKTSFKVEDELYLVMEHCAGGSLADKLKNHGNLHENELVNLFLILTKAFSYLHQKRIVHHDIKPSNLLFTDAGEIKISDFGAINTNTGTAPYYAPELYVSDSYITDPRIDVFALGVTLLECSLGYNPFTTKTLQERLVMLRQADLPTNNLPLWLQDIIFKSINYNVDMRFQTMLEFHEAMINKNIPKFLTRNLIKKEAEAKRLNGFVRWKKWSKAKQFIINQSDGPENETNLNFLINAGNYFLQTHQLQKARQSFEKAIGINSHANIEKQIAEVYLQAGEISKAAAILTNYINRNFNDLEAHNQLLHVYFLSQSWELGLEQSELVLKIAPNENIFISNHLLFGLLVNESSFINSLNDETPCFARYNLEVVKNNKPSSWSRREHPFLYSKLLFQEYKFRNIEKSQNTIEFTFLGKVYHSDLPIISFGRQEYDYNTYPIFPGTPVSRRHFVIINMKNNVWLYNLESGNIMADDMVVNKKSFLLGLKRINFGGYSIELKSDKQILL